MAYECPRCMVSFTRKDYYQKHLGRKVPCHPEHSTKGIQELLNELKKHNDNKYACDHCDAKFAHLSGKSRHSKTCKKKPSVTASEVTLIALQNRIIELEARLPSVVNTNCNNITVNNTQNITVNVNNFGQEDLDCVLKHIQYYWEGKAKGLIEMAKQIHFDPLHPENHTFTITNQRAGIAKVKENGQWVSKPSDEALEEVIYTITREMESFIEEKAQYLKQKYSKSVDTINTWWDKVGGDNVDQKEIRHLIKRLTEMVIMNRHIIGHVR